MLTFLLGRGRGKNSIIPKSKVVAPTPVNLNPVRDNRSNDTNVSGAGKGRWVSQSTNSLDTAKSFSSDTNPWGIAETHKEEPQYQPKELTKSWAGEFSFSFDFTFVCGSFAYPFLLQY